MRNRRVLVATAVLLGLLTCLVIVVNRGVSGAGDPGNKKEVSPPEGGKDQTPEADRKAILKAGKDFIKAFEKGDAKAVASFWTEQGEYIDDDGSTLRGRAAIQEAYEKSFAKHPKRKAKVEVESLRFPSSNSAIEEGYFTVQRGKDDTITSRYSVLHVKENGQWRMAVVREWPREASTLHELSWLIGSWTAKRDDAEVHTTYEWWGDKKFLRMQFTITEKGRTQKGFQLIGRDAATGNVRSWTFEEDGDFGEATWARDGKRWVLDSAGVVGEGSVMSATIILTRVNNDAFTWQAINRVIDGEELEDAPPVKVTRVKEKK
jgi:uncharacterized protein (TIGR02246 family)